MTTPESADRRTREMAPDEVQRANRAWWTRNPMSYDWRAEISAPRYSREWFDLVDHSFLEASRPYATDRTPFDRILPLEDLRGRRVLEIGCGVGLHTETMVRAGAHVTALDLTSTAIEATGRRLALKSIDASLVQGDAERLPEGECRIMVYNREGMSARVAFWRDHVFKWRFLRHSFDETLWRSTDGFTARHYVQEQFEDLFRGSFDDVESRICGQEADALPVPRRLRRLVRRFVSEGYIRRAQATRGSFIFLTARRPAA